MDVAPVPPGYTALTPFIVVDGARAALDFYTAVFGATVTRCRPCCCTAS